MVTPIVNGVKLTMKIDTGASLSLISEATYRQTWPSGSIPPIQPSSSNLGTYTGERIQILGKKEVRVQINQQLAHLNLEVVRGQGPSLMGVDWLECLHLEWNRIYSLQANEQLAKTLDRHITISENTLGWLH